MLKLTRWRGSEKGLGSLGGSLRESVFLNGFAFSFLPFWLLEGSIRFRVSGKIAGCFNVLASVCGGGDGWTVLGRLRMIP